MYKPGFLTELGLLPAADQRVEPEVGEQEVMAQLRQHCDKRLIANPLRPHLTAAQEAHCNALSQEVRMREATLSQLQSTLERLECEQGPIPTSMTAAAAEQEATRMDAVLYGSRRAPLELETQQYEHSLQRLKLSNHAKQNQVKLAQAELDRLSRTHSAMMQELESIEKLQFESLRKLYLVVRHQETIQTSFQDSKSRHLLRLQEQHSSLSSELTAAQQHATAYILSRRQIARLRQWLKRQRDARKVMRLYMGLEELGAKRLDAALETLVQGLRCEDLESALHRYKDAMARNDSLVREAELKLKLQAELEVQVMELLGERDGLRGENELTFRRMMESRVHKADIYHSAELSHLLSAESRLAQAVQRQSFLSMMIYRMVPQILRLFAFLRDIDPCDEASIRLPSTLQSPQEVVEAFLILEKKVVFLNEVTEQRSAMRQQAKRKMGTESLQSLFFQGKLVERVEFRSRVRPRSMTRMGTVTEALKARSSHADDPQSPKSPSIHTCDSSLKQTWSDIRLRKDWELLRKHAQRLHRTEKPPRLTEFMLELRANQLKFARMTAGKCSPMGFRTPPLRIPQLSSPRSKGSTRAETGFSMKSKRETTRSSHTNQS